MKELKTIIFFAYFFITSFFFFSCTEKERNLRYDFYVRDGVIFNIKTDELYSGTITDTLQRRILSYEVVNGRKNGTFTVKFMNGKIEMTGKVKNDLNEGKWQYFYEDGKLESEGEFKNDKAIGEWNWFYPNGNLKEKGVFVKGKKEGTWTFFNKDGTIQKEILYRNNEIVTAKEIDVQYIKSI